MNRSESARHAALILHSRVDSTEHLAPARRGMLARFEREVDPDNRLPAQERARRAEAARRAYMIKLADKSAKARRRAA